MSIDDQSRHRLFNRLEEVLGAEEATILMDHLPPAGWVEVATKRDLDHLAVATKRDLDHLEERLDGRFEAMEHKLLAAFRGELIVQTRTMIFALVGTVVSLAGLAFALTL